MTPKEVVLRALESYRGDNLARTRVAFCNCSPQQMNEQYETNGQTRKEIVRQYEQHEASVNAAIEWLKSRD